MGARSTHIIRAFLASASLAIASMACTSGPERIAADARGNDKATIPALPPLEGTNEYHRSNAGRTSQHHLSNGIPVILYTDESMLVSCIRITFKDTADRPDEQKPGTESLCLQLISRGPSDRTKSEMEAFLYENKVDIFVDASNPDLSSLTMVFPSSRFDRAMPLFTSSFTDPAMREEDFQTLKIARLKELATAEESRAGRAIAALRATAFAGHPYALPPEGELKNMAGTSLEEIKAWRQRELTSDRMIIVAVGDFPADGIVRHLESSFGSLAPIKRETHVSPRWEAIPGFHPLETKEASASWIIGILPAPRLGDADAPAFRVAETILSTLMREHIVNDGLDKPGVGTNFFEGWGSHLAIFVAESDDPLGSKAWIDQSIHAIHEGLSPGGLSPGGLSPSESLESWKAKTLSTFYKYSGSVQALAQGLGEAFIYSGRPDEYFLLDERISRIRIDTVQETAQSWFKPEQATWLLMSTHSSLGLIDKDGWMKPITLD